MQAEPQKAAPGPRWGDFLCKSSSPRENCPRTPQGGCPRDVPCTPAAACVLQSDVYAKDLFLQQFDMCAKDLLCSNLICRPKVGSIGTGDSGLAPATAPAPAAFLQNDVYAKGLFLQQFDMNAKCPRTAIAYTSSRGRREFLRLRKPHRVHAILRKQKPPRIHAILRKQKPPRVPKISCSIGKSGSVPEPLLPILLHNIAARKSATS